MGVALGLIEAGAGQDRQARNRTYKVSATASDHTSLGFDATCESFRRLLGENPSFPDLAELSRSPITQAEFEESSPSALCWREWLYAFRRIRSWGVAL